MMYGRSPVAPIFSVAIVAVIDWMSNLRAAQKLAQTGTATGKIRNRAPNTSTAVRCAAEARAGRLL